jgi:hypothetical protein
MRDPDLVQRAEQAATALEEAWIRWRTRHGLASGPLPPVSSYVGYSAEEPWGQPRVVLGIASDEAERIAAILDGHECIAPIGGFAVRSEPASVAVPAEDAIPVGNEVTVPAPASAESTAITEEPARNGTAPHSSDEPGEPADAAAAHLQELAARSAARPSMAQAFPAAPILPVASRSLATARLEALPATQPGALALRTRTEESGYLQPEATPTRLAGRIGLGGRTDLAAAPAVADSPPTRAEESAEGEAGRGRLIEVPAVSRARRPAAQAPGGGWQRGQQGTDSHGTDTEVGRTGLAGTGLADTGLADTMVTDTAV